jgi:hypothetical protein
MYGCDIGVGMTQKHRQEWRCYERRREDGDHDKDTRARRVGTPHSMPSTRRNQKCQGCARFKMSGLPPAVNLSGAGCGVGYGVFDGDAE